MASDKSKYVSMNLLPHHKEKLDELVAYAGIKRNTFFRALIEGMRKEDVDVILKR